MKGEIKTERTLQIGFSHQDMVEAFRDFVLKKEKKNPSYYLMEEAFNDGKVTILIDGKSATFPTVELLLVTTEQKPINGNGVKAYPHPDFQRGINVEKQKSD